MVPEIPDDHRTGLLLQRVLDGDPAAKDELCSTYVPTVRREVRRHSAYSVLSRFHTDEDLVHEVWLRLWSRDSLRTLRSPGALPAFLAVIASHTMEDLMRREAAGRRRANLLAQFGPHLTTRESTTTNGVNPAASGPSPSELARAADLEDLAWKLLDARERTLWTLVEKEGLSSVEAGRRLGITAEAARSILFRARARLIRALPPGTGQEAE